MSEKHSASAAPPTRDPTVLILVSLLTSLSFITTTIRLAVRYSKRQLGRDDLAIGTGVILSVLQWAFNILETLDGFGQHINYLSRGQVHNVLKWAWPSEIVLFVILPLTKISICLFILRIRDRGWLKWFLYSLMTGLVVTNLTCFVILFAQCHPLRAYWDREVGTCWSVNIYNDAIWAQVGYGIMSDLIISLLPIVILWDIKIATRIKVLVFGLMSLGLVATACATVRAYLSAGANGSKDLTWSLALVTIWAILEEHIAIIGANMALARYTYLFFHDRMKSSKSASPSQQCTLSRMDTHLNTTVRAPDRRASFDSDLPLKDSKITKTTDLHIPPEPFSLWSGNNRLAAIMSLPHAEVDTDLYDDEGGIRA